MNARIRDLYIQAINDTAHHPADDINVQIAERLSVLVVQECLDFLEAGAASEQDGSETQAALLSCALDILEHFDIELPYEE